MPGAPNKPPETAPPPVPSAPPAAESPEAHTLRRLVPSRLALRLPIWKGAPSVDLLRPLREAEDHYRAKDFTGADSALDRLSIRFAEPRWPSLPEAWRSLRVPIPAPQPPQWDPDFQATPEVREQHRFSRYAQAQLTLLKAAVASEAAIGTSVDDLRPRLAEAESAAGQGETGPTFWEPVDLCWRSLLERVPAPADGVKAAPAPAAGADDVAV
ncbi:MAG TPA: hypothetical protein VGV89_08900 [Thermoplasmata archaeon]|nr:hypothetical protein [Thermoplasmata archaeon]